MAEGDKDDKGAMPGQRSRRARPTPTIDLTATEVPPEKSEQADTMTTGPQAAPSSADHSTAGAASPDKDVPPPAASRPSHVDGYLIAGTAGAALVAIAAIVLAFSGYIPARTADSSAIKSQLAEMQSQIAADRTSRQAADQRTIDQLKQRLDRIEQSSSKPSGAAPDVALSDRVTSVENSVKAIGTSMKALNQRAQAAAEAATLAAQKADAATQALKDSGDRQSATLNDVTRRLDALEKTAKAIQNKIANETGSDVQARRALATFALRDAVTRGVPYAEELSVAKTLGAGPADVAALEPFAASGVPDDTKMAAGLKALLPDMIRAAGSDTARPGGFIAKLEANASRLVRIRPVGEPSGDAPSAVLARIEVRLAHNDVAGAAEELAKLPDKVRAVAASWRTTFDRRQAAVAAANRLAADSAGALATR